MSRSPSRKCWCPQRQQPPQQQPPQQQPPPPRQQHQHQHQHHQHHQLDLDLPNEEERQQITEVGAGQSISRWSKGGRKAEKVLLHPRQLEMTAIETVKATLAGALCGALFTLLK